MESGGGGESAMKTIRLPFLAALFLASLLMTASAHAQQPDPGPRGGKGTPGRGGMVVISLPGGGQISFDPNGPFAAILPAGSYRGGGSGSASGGGAGLGPGPKPEFQPIDLEALDAAIRASNANRCLTQMGFVCEPVPPSLTGRPNERSTRIAMSWLIDQLGRELRGDVPLPGIVIRANPDPGIVNVPTWFWVDPITYEGQVFSVGAAMAAPWTLYWDEVIHHHESVTGPCPTDPTRQCVLESHDWNETVTHHEEHRDFVEVTVTLTPAQFAWISATTCRRGDLKATEPFPTCLASVGRSPIHTHRRPCCTSSRSPRCASSMRVASRSVSPPRGQLPRPG